MPEIYIITPWAGATGDLLADYVPAVELATVVTVDNATPAATADTLQARLAEQGVYLRNDRNAGFAGGNNQGYATIAPVAADDDVILFLNSDIAAAPRWLEAVAADVRPGALYGPSLGHQLVGGRWLPYLEGWCIAATRATWRKLGTIEDGIHGPWDADAYPGPYWEDNDLCLRALQAGLRLVQTAWPVQHKGGRTAGPLVRHAQSFEVNRAAFAARAMAWLPAPQEPTAINTRYYQELATQSDIQYHLPLLAALAGGRCVELGTRTGVSTAALLTGLELRGGTLTSVDVAPCGHLFDTPIWRFVQGSSVEPQTVLAALGTPSRSIDLLLIDTLHTYEHVAAELALWGPYVAPGGTIAIHDPETFPGVRRAIVEHCDALNWRPVFVLPNNGMALIEVPR